MSRPVTGAAHPGASPYSACGGDIGRPIGAADRPQVTPRGRFLGALACAGLVAAADATDLPRRVDVADQGASRVVAAAQTAPGVRRSSDLIDAQGRAVGSVHWQALPSGGVRFEISASGLTPGEHAVHVHETGECATPDFKSAGGHFDPAGARHGRVDADADLGEKAHHAGDMPNRTADAKGRLTAVIDNQSVRLGNGPNALLDEDGSALVIHAGPDDYESQPSGAAGPRVACAVIDKAFG